MAQVMSFEDSRVLHEEAKDLENQGRLAAAEHKYLEAIRARESGLGPDHYTTATSYDSLGELYFKMEQLDKAEEYLNKALHARKDSGFNADLAMTRDSLGRLFEMKGDLKAAQEIRLKGLHDNIACGNGSCLRLQNSLKELSKCSVCKVCP
uniref:MFS domain-containing protein n=1 Tax=Ganoderma boninense TaxID=34458 RepID=A0A5K1JZY5_9APHY|nr:MFS domain-containing protein [Ganoderma boninense]